MLNLENEQAGSEVQAGSRVAYCPRERPILMSAPMVLATLNDSKHQTRRIAKLPICPYPSGYRSARFEWNQDLGGMGVHFTGLASNPGLFIKCPYGKVGDRLWVREAFCLTVDDVSFAGSVPSVRSAFETVGANAAEGNGWIIYRASDPHPDLDSDQPEWKPSIHMPRWASRIALEIKEVRVQRLSEISEADAEAEGVCCVDPNSGDVSRCWVPGFHDTNKVEFSTATEAFADLWESINGKRKGCSLADDPWIWARTFQRVKP